MLKQKFKEKTKKQKLLIVLGATVLIVLTLALVLGVLSALFTDGEWTLWSSYRYDEEGYQVGSSSIPSEQIRTLMIDWIDGDVEIVLCPDDALLSVTEKADGELAENEKMRWWISDDGAIFSVKHRKSAAFLGFGGRSKKSLTVRVPVSLAAQLESISVQSKSASVRLEGVSAESLSASTAGGDLTVTGGSYAFVAAETKSGDVQINSTVTTQTRIMSRKGDLTVSNAAVGSSVFLTSEEGCVELSLPEQASFRLTLTCEEGNFVCDRTLTPTDYGYCYGEGSAVVSLSAQEGAVRLYTRK